MHRDRRTRQTKDEEINLTPMLDIVFIMLIFFIVTASFVKERGIELNRPDVTPQSTSESKAILITIADTGQVWMAGRAVDLRSVRANIERMLAENPDAPVVVRTDASASNGTFVRVLDQARQAGASSISLSAEI